MTKDRDQRYICTVCHGRTINGNTFVCNDCNKMQDATGLAFLTIQSKYQKLRLGI